MVVYNCLFDCVRRPPVCHPFLASSFSSCLLGITADKSNVTVFNWNEDSKHDSKRVRKRREDLTILSL